jgi:hypothetical protein
MDDLYRVLYCSRNCVAGVEDVLAVSRQNNARDGITGALLFSANVFAQVLEGPADVVQEAFERIQCDERHSDIVVLQCGPISTRDFPNWAMAYAREEGMGQSPTAAALADAFTGMASGGNALLDLLRAVVAREAQWLEADAAPLERQEAFSSVWG